MLKMDLNFPTASVPSFFPKMLHSDSAKNILAPKPSNVNGYTNGNSPNGSENNSGIANTFENDEHLRKIFIGGLSTHTTVETLRQYFRQFGEMVDAVVMRDPVSNHSRGFAFVTYLSPESVENVQRARPHNIDNKNVETKRALPRMEFNRTNSGPPNIRSTKIFLGGLRDCHSEESIREYFSQFGIVTSVKLLLDKETGRKRGFGFLEFKDIASADRALVQSKHSINYSLVEVKKSSQKYDSGKRLRFPVGGAARAGYIPPQPAVMDNFTIGHGYNPFLAQTTLPPSAFINGWASYVTPSVPTTPAYYGPPRQQQALLLPHQQPQLGYNFGYDQELAWGSSANYNKTHYIPLGVNAYEWPPKASFKPSNPVTVDRPKNDYKSVKMATTLVTAPSGQLNAKEMLATKPLDVGAGGDAAASALPAVAKKWPNDNFKAFQSSSRPSTLINSFHNEGSQPTTYGIPDFKFE
ncbi:RNA-binding protein Musashi homolog 2 [Drosophila tropicalis]|uniref:RNA-binding protein Musashi homolog 2 n=1 Tax=Drosophila tropicalis TaxID=46794 RepID=UPI0035AC190B